MRRMCDNALWVWPSQIKDSIKPVEYWERVMKIAEEHDFEGDTEKGWGAIYDNQFLLRELAK